MKASLKWLKEFVDYSISPKELAHALTMAGTEVEAIEELEDDIVFEIGVTPNRPDCLSIRGIAREISAILDIPFKDISVEIIKEEGEGPVVKIDNPELCPRYSSRIVTGVKPGPSPEWLSKRLESCGIRSTFNIVDVTNYVLLEIGQPMHAFDLDKLTGKKIAVKQAGDVSTFTTLDDEKRNLSKDMLLIWDAERPVAIAGVMGGQNTEVFETTVNILLESAYFKPSSVRRTSKSLNLSTESSYRFERGVDIQAVTLALDRAAHMIVDIAGGRISHITDNYPDPFVARKIPIKLEKINSVIGIEIEKSFIHKTLTNLGFKIERAVGTSVRPIGVDSYRDPETRSRGGALSVIPPSYRNDVEMDIDIVEEVARLYGYDKIPSTLPVIQMSSAPEHKTQDTIKTIKCSMVKSGFSEVINYSFFNPDVLDKLNLPSDDTRRNLVYIKNPLRKEEEAMRTTLIPALLNNVSSNQNRGERMLRFFEISRVFLPSDRKLPDEVIQMGAIYHKDISNSIWQDKHDGFYDLKGAIENLFLALKIRDYSFVPDKSSNEPYLHPGKSCSITISGKRIGSLGTLHPNVSDAFDITGNVNILEIYDIDKLQKAVFLKTTFVSLPKYPYVERDIAIIVSKDVPVARAKESILNVNSDIIESVILFDVYIGKPIPDDKKSLAFSIRYRAAHKTLTDNEVDELHSKIIKRLHSDLKAELRS